MFPPLSCLFLLFSLLFRFPLGVFPLSLLTLKKRLYLREQDTGQSLDLVVWYAGAVVISAIFCYMLLSAHKGNTYPYGQLPECRNSIPTFGFEIGWGTSRGSPYRALPIFTFSICYDRSFLFLFHTSQSKKRAILFESPHPVRTAQKSPR